MFDKNEYYTYSKKLENFSMIKFGIFIIIYSIAGYLIGQYIIKNEIIGLILGIITGIIMQYSSYLKEQIKSEEMKMMLEIHNSITKTKN